MRVRQFLRGHRSPSKRRRSSFLPALGWSLGAASWLYLSWFLFFPSLSGTAGRWLKLQISSFLGLTSFFLPLVTGAALLRRLTAGKNSGWITKAATAAAALVSAAGAIAVIGGLIEDSYRSWGGALGLALHRGFSPALGEFGTLAVFSAVFLVCAQAAFEIRWLRWLSMLADLLGEDYRQWLKAREELSSRNSQASMPAAAPAARSVAVEDSSPPSSPREILPDRQEQGSLEPRLKPKVPNQGSAYAHYLPPPLDLLKPPTSNDHCRPTDTEVTASIANLENTLKSFGVEAAVSGYAPGPVITRYELSPAPGVKVSSIAALENDLALALKARGIRILAPIPGKGAVGVEIPNNRPALVGLREILSSPALPADAPALSFALGLSADGRPMSADLQKMPHLLIAGATNSGKSVCVHSIILSLLFRARPDEVKLLLIDPKRLELTAYEAIPHLFDPMTPSDKVAVVTTPKDAAKSLAALVKLMDRRYEKFQLYGVRHIDSYNREADKRGEPREFFIVVVIDELADLMLVAQESVEDSIQRLTQMARAVGIHLVLATQRPSVDVITGVIKANLPCRIALQVISRIDSKVILDGSGAESLQGRGDLLYLAAGAQKPERCQGAFVSEEEIARVTQHLREQGRPDYPLLETMAKESAADLSSFGVEPLEFSQALKLVLERRRISQDLLKSQFGSSARATNLLSLLEVKGLIHKPEGSNRWEIHYDMISDYLRQHFPQVPIDKNP